MLIFLKNVIRTPFGVGGINKTPEIVLQDPHPPAPPCVSGILGFWGLSVGTLEFSPEAFWSTNISMWVDIWAKCGVDHFWSTALGQFNPPSGRAWLTTCSEIITSQGWKKNHKFFWVRRNLIVRGAAKLDRPIVYKAYIRQIQGIHKTYHAPPS